MDELERKLGVIGNEVAKIEFWPSGSNLEAFRFDVTQHNHSLVFTHKNTWDIKVTVDSFRLIDREKWDSDEKHRHYPAVHRSGIGLLWYSADVEWQVVKQKGKADNIALGYGGDRDRALSGLMPNSPERTVINDLLFRIEQIAGDIFGDELLEKQPAGRERTFAEDSIHQTKGF